MTQRPTVNFTGGLKATDNSVEARTDLEADNTIVAFLLGAQTMDAKTLTAAGNITQAGAATFATGTGAVSLNGPTTIAGAIALTLGAPSTAGGGIVFNSATTANTVTLRAGASGATNPVFILPTADGTSRQLLSTNAAGQLAFITLAAADIDNTGAGRFLVNEPSTLAANLVVPTSAAVPGITIRQGTGGVATSVFTVESSSQLNFFSVDGAGNATVGNTGVVTGNTLTVSTGATTGNAINVASGATTGIGVNVNTATTTGAGVSIVTGNNVTSGPSTSGTALHIDTGTSTFSNGTNLATRGGALNIRSSGVFGGVTGEAALVRVSSNGNFTGSLVSLIADQTTSGTILGISGTSLTTGRAIDVRLGGLYQGQVDGQGAIGAVNIRSGAFTGNILSVSANAAGAGASSNLANFQSPQVDGRLVHVNVTGNYGGAGAVAINANAAVSGTLLRIGGTALASGNAVHIHLGVPTNGAGANPDPTVQKGVNLALGTTGTGVYANTGATYAGNFVDFRVDGVSRFTVNEAGLLTNAGGITTAGNFTQSGATTFSTGTGAISLNGPTTLAGSFTQTGANSFATGTGAVTLGGDTTLAATRTLTAGAGTSAGTAVNVNTGAGLTTGTAVGINTGTSTFSTATGAGLGITSTGAFTGTLGQLTADSTATGTVLGVRANALTTGRALDVDLGASPLTGNTTGAVSVRGTGTVTGTVTGLTANNATTGTIFGVNGTGLSTGKAIAVNLGASTLASNSGAVEITSTGVIASGATVASITANSATSGTLLTVSGTSIGASTGTALNVAVGTPSGADPAVAKAIRLALGTAGTALYANAATGYNGNFIDFRVNGTSALTVSAAGGITTTGNFSQTGAATFSTGTGAVQLNGPTTVGGTSTFAVSGGLATFGAGLTVSAGNFSQTGAGTFSTGTGQVTINGPLTVSQAALQGGVLVSSATGVVTAVLPGPANRVLTSDGTNWVSAVSRLSVIDISTAATAVALGTGEQVIYSAEIPGGSLGTAGVVDVKIRGTLLNNSGAGRTYTLRVKYGATTMFQDVTLSVAAATTTRAVLLDFQLAAAGATGAQSVSGMIDVSGPVAPTAGQGDLSAAPAIVGPAFAGTAAIDSTVAQTLSVTLQSSGTGTQTLTRRLATATLLQ